MIADGLAQVSDLRAPSASGAWCSIGSRAISRSLSTTLTTPSDSPSPSTAKRPSLRLRGAPCRVVAAGPPLRDTIDYSEWRAKYPGLVATVRDDWLGV